MHLVASKELSNPTIFSGNRPTLHRSCATCSELPYDISTMVLPFTWQARQYHRLSSFHSFSLMQGYGNRAIKGTEKYLWHTQTGGKLLNLPIPIHFYDNNKDKLSIEQRQDDNKFSVSDHIFNVEAE